MKKSFLFFLLIVISPFLYATDDVRVLFANTLIFDDTIIFSVKIENKSEQNIYILLKYTLQEIEYRENIKTIFATLSSEPSPLEYDTYYPSGFTMPDINCVAPGQRQLFHIIIRYYKHNLHKNTEIMRTAIGVLKYFLSEPPNYDFWGTGVGYCTYELHSDFYKNNAYSFNSWNLLSGF